VVLDEGRRTNEGYTLPTVTAVLVAAYNADKTIRQAVESVLSGSHDCHIYVVDDCSSTPVSDVLAGYDNVEVIRLKRNRGPAVARNIGLSKILAKDYDYVAIMDADDVSMPKRLARQACFLDKHPRVGAVGTWTRHFDEHTGEPTLERQRPADPEAIRNMMFFNAGISHASAMFRVEALRTVGVYSENYPAAEDYELLRRIGQKYDLANVPECLLAYRVSSQGQSLGRRRQQLTDRLRIQLRYFAPLNWRAWAGVAQTIVSLVVPVKVVHALKQKVMRRQFATPDAQPSSS
jgi:glycosyltransferase involved in cell wall biosynthesis